MSGASEMVHSPSHYKDYFPIEVIEVVRDMNYLWGNAFKYLARARYKGNLLQDLQKCVKYLEWAYEDNVPHGVKDSRFYDVQKMLVTYYDHESHAWWATMYMYFRRAMIDVIWLRYLADDIDAVLYSSDIDLTLAAKESAYSETQRMPRRMI